MAATKGPNAAVAAGDCTTKSDEYRIVGKTHERLGAGLKPTDADAVIKKLGLSDEQLVETYRQMLHIRHFEEACNRAFRAGKVGGYLHLYIGQEAVSSGVLSCFKPGDQVLSTYRDHAHCLLLGSDPGKLMAEIYGKSTGVSRGKGGSMHLYDRDHGFAGGDGIVGGNVPLATGLAWALKYRKTDNICVCFIGDGSMNEGAFHEGLNMAALYRLPVVYVLENNGYAMGTSVERSHANTDLGSRADSYSIPHVAVDGQDYFAMRSVAQEAIDRMRKDPYPFFIDAITYRFVGHGAADGAETQKTYRDESEVERWKQRDPILLLEQTLVARGILDEATKSRLDAAAVEAAKEAVRFAEQSPNCAPEELFQDVYAP
jgi:pyruvate dehydrogenase E1 component alpha subunit